LRGAADVITAWKGWAAAFPDSKATFEAAHISGNTVILELTWRGTQSGPLRTPSGEIPATGRKIEMRACQIVDVADGKARGIRQYLDLATMMAQLGASAVSA
jgi:predicted ester cyclase